jgi:O-antigen ligase
MNRHASSQATAAILVLASLVATTAVTAMATWADALALLLVGVMVAAGLVLAISRPTSLFYLYCAAIPFNLALPPGPAGTISRIAGLIFFIGYLARRPNSLNPRTIPLVGWAFIGWTLVSCLWAIDGSVAFQAWLSLAQLFAITVLIASMVSEDPAIIWPGLWAYALSASVTAAIAIASYLEGGIFGRATAFADQDPALFASLVLPAAIFLMGEVQSRSTRALARATAVACLMVCVVGLALSGTRSAWVGAAVATVVWLIVKRDPRQILAVAALTLGMALLVVTVPGIGAFLFGRIENSLATGGSGRTDIWIVGLSILASAPLVGVGFANFPLAFTPYAIAHASGASNASGALFADRGAHNVLLATTVETGIMGALLLVAFFGVALVRSIGDRGYVIRVALISLYLQAMFLDILTQKQLWLFLGLAFGLAFSERIANAHGRARSGAVGQLTAPPPRPA